MKRMNRAMLLALPLVALVAMIGCEFESTDGFNTSQGGGSAVNFSGVYTGYTAQRSAKAVRGGGAVVGGTDITRLIITQTGNTIEAYDNHNRYYRGSAGSPGVVGSPLQDGSYPAGAAMMAAQVNFGNDDVNFVGVVRAIAVTDVEGEAVTVTVTKEDTETHEDTDTEDEATVTTPTETVTEVETTVNNPPTTVVTTTTDTQTVGADTESRETETDTNTESDSRTKSDATTREYTVDESNTHYVLEGNWVAGGTVYEVHGQSQAVNPTTFTSSSTTTATTGF